MREELVPILDEVMDETIIVETISEQVWTPNTYSTNGSAASGSGGSSSPSVNGVIGSYIIDKTKWPLYAEMDLSHIETEDDEPVDNIYSEKQQRLLTEPLFTAKQMGDLTHQFIALADVGIFATPHTPPIVPDVLVSRDVTFHSNVHEKRHSTYFVWEMGKVPEVVVEIVSNKKGGESTGKVNRYAQMGIQYYIILDRIQALSNEVMQIYTLHGQHYRRTTQTWFPVVQLGVTLWEGIYEDVPETWLRWYGNDGQLIPTGAERSENSAREARQANQRAEEAARQIEEEASARQQANQRAEEAARLAEEEGAARQQANQRAEEAARLVEEEVAARQQANQRAEEEASAREQANQRAEEAARLAEEEATARQQANQRAEEAARQVEEEVAARQQANQRAEEAARLAEEETAARRTLEEELTALRAELARLQN